MLAAVLTEDPVSELGDDVVPQLVRLQASDISPIDDVVVEGRTVDGHVRRVSIGVRRNPALNTSDTTSVPLVQSFLRVVTDQWDEVAAGRWRVALAVGVSSTAVRQTDALAQIAQSVRSPQEFREVVELPAATNEGVRGRLTHLDALVVAAAADVPALSQVDASELTWRWLSALRVRQLRLEGVDETDRTTAVSALRRMVADEAVETADKMFAALAELTGRWASSAARVDQALVRRALSGYPLNRSVSYQQAWSLLDGLARRLREGIRADLSAGEVRLEVDRAEERTRLADAMTHAGRTGAALVVTGEPDVGKSALTLRAGEQLAAQGAAVVSLSLRDLPSSVAEVEHLLGQRPVADVLAAGEMRPVRLLVVDGAEAVLEGRRDLLRELAAAALRAGLGVVAVTRTDGAARVREVLQTATSLSGGTGAAAEHIVARLTPAERHRLVDTFRSLIRLSADARAEWLVGRPGLVDVLLRSGTVSETTELLSEADVFVAVWNGLVRNNEEQAPGSASPDDRERAVLAVARRVLNAPDGAAPGGGVWAQLRSDGVLRAPANPALASGDEFATDLIRDFALCRLFLTSGWEPLRAAGAPRWTIRAVRLACQAKLLAGDRAAVWRVMRREFDELREAEGERWAEVPIEALLTLGDAQTAIEHVWDELAADDHHGVQTLLRLARLRYVTGTFGDPFALAPVIAVTYCSDLDLGQYSRYSQRGLGETVRKLVLAWLRGMARGDHGPDPLRRQVRDRIFAAAPEPYDEFAVEALAMLGPDTDDRTEQWLRDVAASAPSRLRPAVESTGAAFSLVETRPRLLLDLTEAYYIEHPDLDDVPGWGLLDNGIRDHQHGLGFGPPFAAWYYGPFFQLLNKLPADAVDMINRMLDHAAATRMQPARQPHRDAHPGEPGSTPFGVDLDIPDLGARHYVGDAHVWGWYRGSTVGPYPCMSALLAVERFADHLISKLDIPPKAVVQLLLRNCNNLAMPGLVVGLLVRHLDVASDLLDSWLSSPDVWGLEFNRTTAEGHLHVQGADPEDVVGRDRRRFTPRDAAAEMTLRAMIAGDQPRLDALAAVADQLLVNAQAELGDDSDDRLVVVQGWASVFQPENYPTRRAPDGTLVAQYEPPAPVAEALAPSAADFRAGSEALRLELTYTDHDKNPGGWPADTLLADITLARQFTVDPPTRGPLHPEDPLAAVAAAAITSHARGLLALPDDDLRWAVDAVLNATANPHVDGMSYQATTYPMAADRSAAKAVPSVLLAPFDHLALDSARIEEALTALATSLYDEVRTAFVSGCALVWSTPCTNAPDGAPCRRHELLWAAVQAGLRECRLGPWNKQAQRRQPQLLPPPYTDTLPTVPAADLVVNRLAMPIACTAAARSTACLTSPTAALLPVLLDAHRIG
ncbi:ATP-binding protein, partial [Streptomyces sp. ISL-96]